MNFRPATDDRKSCSNEGHSPRDTTQLYKAQALNPNPEAPKPKPNIQISRSYVTKSWRGSLLRRAEDTISRCHTAGVLEVQGLAT